MPNRDPAFDDYVIKIHQVLPRLDYYRLLGVAPDADEKQIRSAFLKITRKFHPDRHRNAPSQLHLAIYDIFKRLNEAYRVLSDPDKRQLYDSQLANGKTRFSTDLRMSMVPRTPEQTIRSKDARTFYIRAVECLASGSIMQAELHAKMAASRESDNAAIRKLIADILEVKRKK